ncbi:YIP1 family protein [Alteromonas sp. C1M14]|uniref:YIP1 family protein n=1 Tax=Alteromonas sp. C1M14 TaxID=2841567 RepID=UPI001C083BFB|nr:YIP1 family protein [Alteromonas sp. C1M14]MBU2977345.1 YIP1 family protein [Alteromonas sp. C1M14]
MQGISNPFKAVSEIFVRPNGVFYTLDNTSNWSWIPFFIIAVVGSLPVFIYFNNVDFTWYKDFLVNASLSDVSPAEQQAFTDQLSQPLVKWSSTIGTVIGYMVANAILAVYLMLVTRQDEKSVHGYTDWYGFTWWVTLPVLVSSVLSLVLLLLNGDPQISPSILNPLSVGTLLGVDISSPYSQICESLRLDMLWSIYLTAVGLGQWTQFNSNKAWIAASAPFVIIYTVWLFFTLF